MTAERLIKILEQYPPNTKIVTDGQSSTYGEPHVGPQRVILDEPHKRFPQHEDAYWSHGPEETVVDAIYIGRHEGENYES